jgi:hypothetical protein
MTSAGSVGAGLHGRGVEGLLVELVGLQRVVRDPLRTALLEGSQQVPVLDQDMALVLRLQRIELQLGPRVRDVEVPKGQLADPVGARPPRTSPARTPPRSR